MLKKSKNLFILILTLLFTVFPLLSITVKAEAYSDNLSCGSELVLNIGMQKTVYLLKGNYTDYKMSNDAIEIQKISHNVLNFRTKKPGTTVFTASDTLGNNYKTSITVLGNIPTTDTNDYVNYTISGGVISNRLNITSMIRRIEMNTGYTISFASQKNSRLQYRYSIRTENEPYKVLTQYSENGSFKFSPSEPKKYYIRLQVKNSDTGNISTEFFVITAVGNSMSDDFVEKNKTLQVNKGEELTLDIPDGIQGLHTSSKNIISTTTNNNTLSIKGKAVGSSVITIVSRSGKLYKIDITINKKESVLKSTAALKFDTTIPTVHVGSTVKVRLTVSDPAHLKKITCKSSNPSIASVSYSDGVCTIKGINMGRAYITASLPDGTSCTDYIYSIGSYNDYRTEKPIEKGIDVSCWNVGTDFNKLKELGYTFVIIRAGFGNELSQKDSLFEEHIKNAKKAGLGIGIYYFSYAVDTEDAKKEAAVCSQTISKYRDDIKYGVYFDYEEDSVRYAKKQGYTVNKKNVTAITKTFCEEIEKYGFVAGVYTNTYFGTTLLDMNELSKYLLWYAAPGATTYAFDFDVWQYSFELNPFKNGTILDGNKVYSTVFQKFA